MKLLEKYFFNIFSSSFFPIFFTLYIVVSIIFLVEIAALTSIIQINFFELMKIYSFYIPTILFYSLPISYFIGLTIAISKLSIEYETIVITSFGLKPFSLLKLFLPVSFFISILLFMISFGLIPKAKYLKTAFINVKQQEAKFNIKASEYGQQIGSWMIYVNKEKDSIYQDVALLEITNNMDKFISSKYAVISAVDGLLSIKLQNGKSFNISNNIKQVDFKKMILNSFTPKIRNIKSLNDIIMYWKDKNSNRRKSKAFSFNILISLFPLISVFFYLAIGYFNPRYDSSSTTAISSLLIVLFVVLSNKFAKTNPNIVLAVLPISWFFIGYMYYWFRTKKLY